MQYTLVLTKGSKDAVAQFFLWLESRFDCFVNVAALRVAPVHIEALAHEWSVLGWGSAAGNDANDSDGDGGDGGGGGGGGDGGDGGGGGGGNSSKRRGAKRTAAAAAPAAPPAAKRRVPAAKPLQCRYVMPPSIRGVRAITLTAPPESMAPLVARCAPLPATRAPHCLIRARLQHPRGHCLFTRHIRPRRHVWRASARVPVWRLTSPRPWSVPDVLRDFFRAQTGISLGHASMDLAHTPVAVISADAKLKVPLPPLPPNPFVRPTRPPRRCALQVLAERHLAAVLAGVARVCQPPARAAAAAEVEEEDTRKVVAPTHPLLQQSPAM